MSTSVLPSLDGLGFDVVRTPVWDTTVQTAVSGKEIAIANQTYPRWQWNLTYEFLRADATNHEFQDLVGFFNSRQGRFDTFLYRDATDNSVTAQQIGVGDSTTRTFQLRRSFGGFIEPILAPNVVSKVYVDGVDAVGTWSVSNWGTSTPGVITFSPGNAPGAADVVTADFTYYWPCRMLVDSVPFNMFLAGFYGAKGFGFISVKS